MPRFYSHFLKTNKLAQTKLTKLHVHFLRIRTSVTIPTLGDSDMLFDSCISLSSYVISSVRCENMLLPSI